MKITIIGAAGVRTPLIVKALARRQARLALDELALMDIDGARLETISRIAGLADNRHPLGFKITRTTDAHAALAGARFVITTFRAGGVQARAVDERVALAHGVLGQETTGPGGFAMAMRSIPVLLHYVDMMRELCPDAWLINFANPAGMLAEAAISIGGWHRTAGICDSPHVVARVAAAMLNLPAGEVFLDYFGLNHLGWTRRVLHGGQDYLPQLMEMIRDAGGMPDLPFDAALIESLGMLPNEYLYYYYYSRVAVRHLLEADQSRAEEIVALNEALFADLARLDASGDTAGMERRYRDYLARRSATYMTRETGGAAHDDAVLAEAAEGEGYAGVALDLIEALEGIRPAQMILNIPNRGAIAGMAHEDVVEVPVYAGRDFVRPLAAGKVPGQCLGLMLEVKAYEQLTIAAAVEGSYAKAVAALAIHPLVRDYQLAAALVDAYRTEHGELFPALR